MVQRNKKIRLLALYQSEREITSLNRFIRPLLELSSRGHEIHLIYTGKIISSYHTILHPIRNIRFPFIPSFPFLTQSFIIALGALKKNDINVFLCYREEDLILGWLLKRIKKNISLVYYAHGDSITVQGLNIRSFLDKIKYSLSLILEKIFLTKADLIVTVSLDTKSRILSRMNANPNRFSVIYNNVLPSNPRPVPLMERLKKDNKIIIGFVGYLDALKGVKTLLYAFSLLNEERNNMVLVFVGDGPMKKSIEDFVKLKNLNGKVIFTGWVRNPLDYMQYFDVLVLPSLYEGCPSVILEAFSLGIPVLGSKAGGIPELLNYEELLFQPLNYCELANKLKVLFNSNENYTYFKRLIEERKKTFSFDHTSIIEKVLTMDI
jgi:glycosyltransferase involved in cell wall biosynthesis